MKWDGKKYILVEEDIDDILAEYDSEETERLRRIYRRIDNINQHISRLEWERLDLMDEADVAEKDLLAVGNEEGWEV